MYRFWKLKLRQIRIRIPTVNCWGNYVLTNVLNFRIELDFLRFPLRIQFAHSYLELSR